MYFSFFSWSQWVIFDALAQCVSRIICEFFYEYVPFFSFLSNHFYCEFWLIYISFCDFQCPFIALFPTAQIPSFCKFRLAFYSSLGNYLLLWSSYIITGCSESCDNDVCIRWVMNEKISHETKLSKIFSHLSRTVYRNQYHLTNLHPAFIPYCQ